MLADFFPPAIAPYSGSYRRLNTSLRGFTKTGIHQTSKATPFRVTKETSCHSACKEEGKPHASLSISLTPLQGIASEDFSNAFPL